MATVKMTYAMKMKAIRKALKMTHLNLAVAMDCSSSTVDSNENGRTPISDKMYKAFKKATGMEDVPLTDIEVARFKQERLNAWNFIINYGDIDQAKELQPKIAYCVKWSYDTDLQILYEIYSINYYSKIDKKEDSNKIVDSLSKRENDFTEEHFHWYYRYIGVLKNWKWHYKSAVEMYMKAEDIGDRLGLNDKALYYYISSCLTYMGYPYQALIYLEKLRQREFNASSISYLYTIQKLLAVNYSKLGRTEEALELLENYLVYLTINKGSKTGIGGVYFFLGWVYQNTRNIEKALENYEKAAQHYDDKGELYLSYLCHKASLLRAGNRNDEVEECLKEGLFAAPEGSLWYEWLNAIKHSLTLDKKGSIEYIEWTAIPRLHEYGRHTIVIECYEWLSSHHQENRMYMPALEYSEKAKTIYRQLIEGDLSL